MMSIQRNVLIASTALLLLGTALGLYLNSQESSTVAPARVVNPKQKMFKKFSASSKDHRIHAMQREIDELKRVANAKPLLSKQAAEPNKELEQDAVKGKLTPEQFAMKEQEAFDAIVDGAAERFDEDRADVDASKVENQMRDYLLSQNFEGLSIESVECRSRQCQIIIHHQDSGSLAQLNKAWDSDVFEHGAVVKFAEELSQTIVFAARDSAES